MSGAPSLADLARRPILARLLVIAACAMVALAQRPTLRSLEPALVLVFVAAFAAARLPASVPRWLQPTAEGLAAGALVGALGSAGSAYTAYTLVPVTVAGFTARGRKAMITVAATSLVYVLASAAAAPAGGLTPAVRDAVVWSMSLFAFGLLAVSARWVRSGAVGTPDASYVDAHRLLSELEPVSRRLSLGLDPSTVAAALREDLCTLAGTSTGCVIVRTDGGRFVALAGEAPAGADDARLAGIWSGADAVTPEPGGQSLLWLHVTMADEPVALAVLSDMGGDWRPGSLLRRLRPIAGQAGPRLASALLFEEVRQLATVDERHRLAREIHDSIAQDLASLAYLVDDVRQDADPQTAARLTAVGGHVRRLVKELRLRLFDLRAGVSDTESLGNAVSSYLQQVRAQTGLTVQLTLDEGQRRLPTSVEVEVLRILQEAVTNVRRHAQARRVQVELSVHPPHARLVVEDDGRGMQSARPDSLGLTGMAERAARIGARLAVVSAPAGGTRVSLVMDGASARVPPTGGRDVGHHVAAAPGIIVPDYAWREEETSA